VKYEKLFTPIQINGVELKNRIVMSPMHDGLGLTGGDVNDQVIEYFAARAKGGVGLIINGFTVVCPDELCGTAGAGQSHLTTLDNRNSFQLLAERVHEYDCKIFVQLHHPGRSVYAPQFLNGGRQPVSSTAMPASLKGDSHAAPARELTVAEIKQIVKCYAIAAQGAYTAGCDGVEVHCAHGYLFSQFINPFKNERKDEYGGSLENCCRIATETLDAIRKVVPKSFPVSVRVNGAEGDFRPNGKEWDMNYMRGVVKLLVEHGADMVNVSMGGIDCMPNPDMRARYRDDIIKNIKEVVNVPVAAVNCLKTPEEAEGMLEDGVADMAILGRQLICDPEWANKARTGHEDDIRPCLSCNNCIHHSSLMQPIRCAINPLAGREAEDNTLVPGSGNAVVIGAGPAGIEAALTLAAKGYDVTMYEKSGVIGGSINLADKAPGKFRMDILLDYWRRQLEKNERITVKLNTEITDSKLAEIKRELDPKVVCLNVGGKPVIPAMPGLENAVTAHDVLSGKVTVEGKRVVIIGGGMTALETAEFMAERGNTIVLCEMMPQFAADTFIYRVVKTQLGLARQGVCMKPHTMVLGANSEGVMYRDLATGLESVLPAEVIVLSLGVRPDRTLRAKLEEVFDNVIVLGDSNKTGTLQNATGATFHRLKRI
jgi:2,4-dienoyl-CoA reductase-like NADH-dependent reductase (Old Yellow Enzyme family)/thioredoxin reductase